MMRRARFTSVEHMGYCPPAIYVDGAPYDIRSNLNQFPPDQIGAVEVYPGASTVPARFGGARSGCGVIALWTRAHAGAAKKGQGDEGH